MDNNRDARASVAQETLGILQNRRYAAGGKAVDISGDMMRTSKNSGFIAQVEADRLETGFAPKTGSVAVELRDESTLDAILRLDDTETKPFGVLNFASAKNPGGGFLNGAMAQEESLAAASGLYSSQLEHPDYYDTNRACRSMMYTDCAIWSPDVVFFRDGGGNLMSRPAHASVLTLPAVNYGQVLQKNESAQKAKAAMKRRMKIALAIFADKGCDVVVLGAYGCGVFRNNASDVAKWWDELLSEYGGHFRKIVFAVYDRSKTKETLSAFRKFFMR